MCACLRLQCVELTFHRLTQLVRHVSYLTQRIRLIVVLFLHQTPTTQHLALLISSSLIFQSGALKRG